MNGIPIVTEYKGKMYGLKEICEITGLAYQVIYARYKNGDRGDRLFRSPYDKVCKICGKEFVAIASNTKCCSEECIKENKKNKLQEMGRQAEEKQTNQANKTNKERE